MEWGCVVVLDSGERRTVRHQAFHRGSVAVTRCDEHCEDVVRRRVESIGKRPPPAGRELHRTDERQQDEPTAAGALDVMDQLGPAWEPVLARNREVCACETDSIARCTARDRVYPSECRLVSAARVAQQVFGLLPELFEGRARGERATRSGRTGVTAGRGGWGHEIS